MASARTTNGKGGKTGAVRVTAAARKRHDSVVRELAAARKLRADGWDRYWELVGEVLADELYLASGAGSAQAWLAEHLGDPYRTAFRCVRVAQHVEPADEARYGVERLDAAIAFVEATAGLAAKGQPPVRFAELRVPVVRRGKQRELGLLEVTPAEIDVASAAAAGTSSASSALRAVKTLRSVKLRSIDGHVTFGHVPLAQLEVALRALAQVDWRALADAPKTSARAPNPVARALVAREKASSLTD